jgi:ABC-type nitrate/sulfonate/bicarbonate transport system permease component
MGIGEESKVAAVALSAFFPSLINAMAGVRGIAPTQIELARNYGASPAAMVRRVLLPGSLPMALTGLRALLWNSWQMFRVERVYATIGVIAMLGMVNTSLIRRLRRRVVPWLPDDVGR